MTSTRQMAGVPDRDGLPLPGLTLPVVLSQLAFRVLGPEAGRARSVLDHLGLLGLPAGQARVTAARHQISTRTLRLRTDRVREAGVRLPLTPMILVEATRHLDADTDDIKGRVRQARILGLSVTWPEPLTRKYSPTILAHAFSVAQVLAITGPTPWDVLQAAAFRRRTAVPHDRTPSVELSRILQHAVVDSGYAQIGSDHRWYPIASVSPPPAWVTISDSLLAGVVYGRSELLHALGAIGYSPGGAERLLRSHPLIDPVGRGRYQLLSPIGPDKEVDQLHRIN